MTLTSILAREGIPQFQRWELPLVNGPGAVPANDPKAEADEGPHRPTVAEIEAIERQAREEGFNAGLAEGRATAQRELVAQTARLDALFAAAAQPLANLDAEVAMDIAQLATVIAERVLGYEIAIAPERIVDIVRQAVDTLPVGSRHLKIYLHPADAAIVRDHRIAADHGWVVADDDVLERGDCRLESESSRLDATVRKRLAAVIDAVLEGHADTE
ncbi:flagellar assembly protein FliH [Luteibacter rhizovicinus]|uniref:Flagellar assembly protein FliH n=1 Tax=Luteibacter rhizovicinus TaxID=242606 RepID=A0A4R3YSA5_9GAMM|nr:flagellar assembly protein FliH [Luteibacter rhizovicinus]TCV94154.1 flagellar assembly protein FliH [Luteibacter rhizovicinus]